LRRTRLKSELKGYYALFYSPPSRFYKHLAKIGFA
jgi:hypothetical protein